MPDSPFAPLRRARFASLTTWRRSGDPVATPVWVVVDDACAYVVSRGPGKVKRIAANPHVTLAPCTMRGVVSGSGPAAQGTATIAGTSIPKPVRRLLLRKYGPFAALALVAARLSPRKPVLLRIAAA
jgi:PPOX class probable F420-dependent enzyme